MSRLDDDYNDMTDNFERDDRDVDSVLRGRRLTHRPDLEPLAALVDDARLLAAAPAVASPTLAAMLASGLPAAPSPRPLSPTLQRQSVPAVRWSAAVRWAVAVRWSAFTRKRASVTAGALTSLALLSVTSAAMAGVLPDPLQNTVSTVVETVTPWRVPRPERQNGTDLERDREAQRRETQRQDKQRQDKQDSDKQDKDKTERDALRREKQARETDDEKKLKKLRELKTRDAETGRTPPTLKPTSPAKLRGGRASGTPPGTNGGTSKTPPASRTPRPEKSADPGATLKAVRPSNVARPAPPATPSSRSAAVVRAPRPAVVSSRPSVSAAPAVRNPSARPGKSQQVAENFLRGES